MRAEEVERILEDFDWKFAGAQKGKWQFVKGEKRAVINMADQEFQSNCNNRCVFILHVNGVIVDQKKKTLTINLAYADESMVVEGAEKIDSDLRN